MFWSLDYGGSCDLQKKKFCPSYKETETVFSLHWLLTNNLQEMELQSKTIEFIMIIQNDCGRYQIGSLNIYSQSLQST